MDNVKTSSTADNIIPGDKVDLVAIPVGLFCITFRLCAGRYCHRWSEPELSCSPGAGADPISNILEFSGGAQHCHPSNTGTGTQLYNKTVKYTLKRAKRLTKIKTGTSIV